jgi:hypothetical protein
VLVHNHVLHGTHWPCGVHGLQWARLMPMRPSAISPTSRDASVGATDVAFHACPARTHPRFLVALPCGELVDELADNLEARSDRYTH